MTIAIHLSKNSFSEMWIKYCDENHISYRIVDCYKPDIIQQLEDCDALMWHFHQGNYKDILFAKQLLYAVQAAGKKVFPDFHTSWHFDDKVGQKYLLEAIGAPLVPTWIFYSKKEAMQWIRNTNFPKVFKLRAGASSQNVRLVNSREEASRLIHKSFGRGFAFYDSVGQLRERWRLYKLGNMSILDVGIGIFRLFVPPLISKVKGREKGYAYFQEFIPDNDCDIRVNVVNDKAFALKRIVRKNDFRASGSGEIQYNSKLFDENTIKLAFSIAEKLNLQCSAFDFIYDNGKPIVIEFSYGFVVDIALRCHGYWDKDLNWYEGEFNPFGWMIEDLIGK